MKPSVSLIFVVLLAIQAFNVSSTGSHLDALFAGEAPQDLPHQKTIQVLFNLPTIVTGFLEYQDTLHSISQLYQYYLNAQIFENLMFDFFRFMDVDKSGIISTQEYQQAMIDAGISRVAADRVYGLASLDNPTRELGFGDFKVAMEMFFAESMAQVTFAYLTGGPAQTENVGVPLETLNRGILEVFEQLDENYPQPGCDQIEYLFREFDKDQDNKLNPEEFYHVLAIFLRYYKSGLTNVYYSKILHRDDVFTLLWERETTEISKITRRETIHSAASDYFLLGTYEKILNSVGHDIFQVIDENHNGVLELDEFKTLLAMFSAPESEALLLFTTADTDDSGSIDYGEFLVTFETFVRRALASLIFNLAQLNGQQLNLQVCSQAWKSLASEHHVNIGLTDDAFEALFELLDVNDDGVLDNTEFAEFTSTILTAIKKKLREDIDAKISVVAGLNATTSTISDVYEDRIDAPSNLNVPVAQGIVSRILSRVSVVQSEFASATTETTETTTTTLGGIASTSTVVTTTNEDFDQADQKTFGFIDVGMTPGSSGFGFSLYDVVQESLLAVNMKEFPDVEKTNKGAAFGILLQGKLRNIGRPEH